MGEPPSEAGGSHDKVTSPSPASAEIAVGGPGTLAGVTLFETADAGLVPIAFVAVTVKVYAMPFVKPATVIGDALPVPVKPLGFDVTV